MNKTRQILLFEIGNTLRSKSFLLTTLGIPLVAALIFVGVTLLRNGTSEPVTDGGPAAGGTDLNVEGYVDQAGLIARIGSDVPAGILLPFPDETRAAQALSAGDISAYYLIAADYIDSGSLIYVNPGYVPLSSTGQSWVMRQTLFENLVGDDPARLARAYQPMEVWVVAPPSNQSARDGDNPLVFMVPYISMMILYAVIMMAASMLLNSVGDEKKNRTIEVILLSVSPHQLLAGKIIGLGLLGLFQTLVWVGTGYSLLRLAGQTISLPAGIQLPLSLLVWELVFFLLGYAVYASLMAGLGALVPNLKEASQAVFLVIWPLIVPMLFIAAFIERPNGVLASILSIFPLTAPLAMTVRLVNGQVPWWQLALAVVLLGATAVFIVRAVAGMFRAQALLSGQPFSARRFLAALFGSRIALP